MKALVFLALGLGFPLVILWSLSDEPPEIPVEQEMAIVNRGGNVPASDGTVAEFRGFLERLESRTSNSRREIADLCMSAYLWRKERGSLDTLLEFMSEVEALLPEQGSTPVDLKPLLQEMLQPRS